MQCRFTKVKLDRLGIRFEEVPVVGEVAEYVRGLGFSMVPVVEVECGDGAQAHWAGFRPTLIDQLDKCVKNGVDFPCSGLVPAG